MKQRVIDLMKKGLCEIVEASSLSITNLQREQASFLYMRLQQPHLIDIQIAEDYLNVVNPYVR